MQRTKDNRAFEGLTLSAMGKKLELLTPESGFCQTDCLWRLRHIYEPYLASVTLPGSGVALDIGSGFGSFAIPFAAAHSGWTVWCFEPDENSFEALTLNIQRHDLSNVVALNFAVGGAAGFGTNRVLRPTEAKRLEHHIASMARKDVFSSRKDLFGFIRPGIVDSTVYDQIEYPVIPGDSLIPISPSLVKITAPYSEQDILAALKRSDFEFLVGEMWDLVRTGDVVSTENKKRKVYLPVAGRQGVALRYRPRITRSTGLDVVVPLYNNKRFVGETVASLLAARHDDIKVIVVDDGSTDGGCEFLRREFSSHKNLEILSKSNGGCASARNFGRMNSNAEFIAFVDADDLVDAQFFPELLELARYTGAEVVQGGFDFLKSVDGVTHFEDSYESLFDYAAMRQFDFFSHAAHFVPAHTLIAGQPSIWRRIYRRDFLDNKNVWFPEHIRAFDDQMFQLLTLVYAKDVPAISHVNLHYRQHDGQDIRQGDERAFYSLEMFRLVVKRGLDEGWETFDPVLRSYINTVNWSAGQLRPDLREPFLEAAAELWVFLQKALGRPSFEGLPTSLFSDPAFAVYEQIFRRKMKKFGDSLYWMHMDSPNFHVSILKRIQLMERAKEPAF